MKIYYDPNAPLRFVTAADILDINSLLIACVIY